MRHDKAKSRLLSLICSLAATSLACSGSTDTDAGGIRDAGPAADRDAGEDVRDSGPRDGGPNVRDGGDQIPDSGCTIEELPSLTPDPACMLPGAWTVTVSGEVRRANGQAADGALAFICLTDARTDFSTCLRPRPTCSDGRYEVLVEESFRCSHHIVARVASTSPGFAYAYCDVPNGPVQIEVAQTMELIPTTPPPALPPEGDANAVRTVTFASGLEVDLAPAALFGGYNDLSSVKVDQADVCTLANSPDTYEGIYAFYPELNVLAEEGFPVRIPNSTNLAPGTVVRMSVLGGLACVVPRPGMTPYNVRESEWYEFGTATVSNDGMTIEGDNLPCFGWLAYKQ